MVVEARQSFSIFQTKMPGILEIIEFSFDLDIGFCIT